MNELATDSNARAIEAAGLLRKLSARQRDVLEGMTAGLLNKQIAHHLQLSEKTIKMHRALMIEALNVATSAAAIRIAVEASFAENSTVHLPALPARLR